MAYITQGKLGGEDLDNDVLVVATKTVTTQTHQNAALSAGGTAASQTIDSSIFRKFRVVAAGSSGNVQVIVEWSATQDGSTGWFWIGEANGSQWPGTSGEIIAPYVRVTINDQSAAPQSVNAWLVLQS